VAGLTLDSGALIAIERSQRNVFAHLKEAHSRGLTITVPTVVVGEVWRGGARSALIARVLAASVIEPLSDTTARAAGEALGRVRGAGLVDAVVMASASSRGDVVLTSDLGDLTKLRAVFPAARPVRV
jgi:predicted nucleic acid-binding protein